MDKNSSWDDKITRRVKSVVQNGYKTLSEVLQRSDGAQPKDVEPILHLILEKGSEIKKRDSIYKNKFFFQIPASNPLFYQWWFTLDSQEKLSSRVLEGEGELNTVCIGTPTIAAGIASLKSKVHLLDIDGDLVKLFNKCYSESDKAKAEVYDASTPLPVSLKGNFNCAVLDPPWYPNYFFMFFSRAIELVQDEGLIYCSMPQILTRPGIEEERRELINAIVEAGHEVLFIEHSSLRYVVPNFEEIATKNSGQNIGNQPWRNSDLLIVKVRGNNTLDFVTDSGEEIISFSQEKSASLFRVFIRNQSYDVGVFIKENELFSKSISNRDKVGKVNIWTSDKKGFETEDIDFCKLTFKYWAEGKTKEDTIKIINSLGGLSSDSIKNKIAAIESSMHLWEFHGDVSARRTDEVIKEKNESIYSDFASKPAKPSNREHEVESDGFRIEYQRDRDRIIWSAGFRKLSDKTQLFPLDEDDHLRQRLAHSIEVMQLATTISNSFGLNKDLVEAGALAHDIGHTPFGHAGETALDNLFEKLGFSCGFNHYEHGVDVVRYLEGSYQTSVFAPHSGLNLTPEVCDCILKHTYCHTGEGPSHETIWKKTKHGGYLCNEHSHLEGQAVRAADKISYLLSDLEDGIKLGAIKDIDLMSCRLFHRSPIDFRLREGQSLYIKYLEQRGAIIKVLMEDVILESSKRISKISSLEDVKKATDYTIFHSKAIELDMDEIWHKIQAKRLHSDTRVLSANMKASKKISELTLLFTLYPDHIEEGFSNEHGRLNSSQYMDFYNKLHKTFEIPSEMLRFLPLDLMIGFNENQRKSIPTYQLILAKDYVASLSDKKVNRLYESLLN